MNLIFIWSLIPNDVDDFPLIRGLPMAGRPTYGRQAYLRQASLPTHPAHDN